MLLDPDNRHTWPDQTPEDGKAKAREAEALKPCPFCGGEATYYRPAPGGVSMWVYCRECSGIGPTADTAEKARAAWNRRKEA